MHVQYDELIARCGGVCVHARLQINKTTGWTLEHRSNYIVVLMVLCVIIMYT